MMPGTEEALVAALLVICGLLVVTLLALWLYARYLPGPSRSRWAWLALALGAVTTVWFLVCGGGPYGPTQRGDELWQALFATVFAAGLWFFTVPLLVAQWQRWFAPGDVALKATASTRWITGGDVVCIIGTAACFWLGWRGSFWAGLALAGLAVMVGPMMRLALGEARGAAAPEPPMTEERRRVLKLLEEGRITADESAELLSALGQSAAGGAAPPVELSSSSKLLLIGAAVVLVGFLLPWYAVNLGQEMARSTQSVQFHSPMHPGTAPMALEMPFMQMQTSTTYITGGDVGRGAWLVLGVAMTLAVLPWVTRLSESSRKMVSLVLLAVGGVVLLYLITQGIRYVHIGLILVLVGYAVQAVALLRNSTRRPDANPQQVQHA